MKVPLLTRLIDTSMERNYKERNKAIWRLMRQRKDNERLVLYVLALSILYALVSNLLTHCSPLNLPPNVLDCMPSIDETLRNICYGIVASATFYLLNDFYKNAYKKVDLYNDMYPSLYRLWLKVYQLVLLINNRELDETPTNEELLASIIKNLRVDKEEDATRSLNIDIRPDLFHIIYVMWEDALKDKEKFLEVYGHVIEREEYSKLNDKELDISLERIKTIYPGDEHIAKGLPITISDYDIQRAIYLILKYKSDLASMVNRCSIYYYDEERGIRKDAF